MEFLIELIMEVFGECGSVSDEELDSDAKMGKGIILFRKVTLTLFTAFMIFGLVLMIILLCNNGFDGETVVGIFFLLFFVYASIVGVYKLRRFKKKLKEIENSNNIEDFSVIEAENNADIETNNEEKNEINKEEKSTETSYEGFNPDDYDYWKHF